MNDERTKDMDEKTEARLSVLAATINEEAGRCRASVLAALTHALNCGEALLEARQTVGSGHWEKWLADNVPGLTVVKAATYQRLATYKTEILSSRVALGSIDGAVRYLREIEAPPASTRYTPKAEFDEALARKMRSEGHSYSAIAVACGVSKQTALYKLDPDFRRRSANASKRAAEKRKAERKAFQTVRRTEEVKRAGGAISRAYALIRKAALEIQAAHDEATTSTQKVAIRSAGYQLTRAETEIVKAIRLGREDVAA